jgi:hypothetical protein
VIEKIAVIVIKDTMIPYSMAVAPDSSQRNLLKRTTVSSPLASHITTKGYIHHFITIGGIFVKPLRTYRRSVKRVFINKVEMRSGPKAWHR